MCAKVRQVVYSANLHQKCMKSEKTTATQKKRENREFKTEHFNVVIRFIAFQNQITQEVLK